MAGQSIRKEYKHSAWDDFELYGWFAERYHWTPEQVDNLPAWTLHRYGVYAHAWDEVASNER